MSLMRFRLAALMLRRFRFGASGHALKRCDGDVQTIALNNQCLQCDVQYFHLSLSLKRWGDFPSRTRPAAAFSLEHYRGSVRVALTEGVTPLDGIVESGAFPILRADGAAVQEHHH